MELGTKAKYLIANLEAKKNLDNLKLQFRACLLYITKYLQDHLPHQSIFLKDLVCIQPDERNSSASASSIRRIGVKIAKVLKSTNLTQLTPEYCADEVVAEYKAYQSETFHVPETDPENPLRIEDYWSFIGKIKNSEGNLKFKTLVKLVRICLSVSHGNSDPERGFSENKHILDGRECLGEDTIVAIRLVKESVRLHGGIQNFPINRRLINLFENTKTAYDESQAMKKAQKTLQENAKKKSDENAALARDYGQKLLDIEKQISDQQNIAEAANKVLEDGQATLQKCLEQKKVNRPTVIQANALIKLSMENPKVSKNKLAELVEQKNNLIEKMKKIKKKTH